MAWGTAVNGEIQFRKGWIGGSCHSTLLWNAFLVEWFLISTLELQLWQLPLAEWSRIWKAGLTEGALLSSTLRKGLCASRLRPQAWPVKNLPLCLYHLSPVPHFCPSPSAPCLSLLTENPLRAVPKLVLRTLSWSLLLYLTLVVCCVFHHILPLYF